MLHFLTVSKASAVMSLIQVNLDHMVWHKVIRFVFLLLALLLSSGLLAKTPTELGLTADEQSWLSQHRVLTVATSSGWAPISVINGNGNFSGMSIDYLDEVGKLLGVRFNFVPINDQHLAEKVHIISAITNPVVNKPDGYVANHKPYLKNRLGIYLLNNVDNIDSLEDLHGKRVVVYQNRLASELLAKDHPKIKLIKADIAEEALQALAAGNVEAYVGNIAVINYVLRNQGIDSIKLGGLTPYSSEIYMAVSADAPELASALQKALNAIPEERRNVIFDRWIKISDPAMVNYLVVYTIIGLMLLFLLLLALRNNSLKREVKYRKRAESEISRAHGILGNVIDCVSTAVFWMDVGGRYMGCNKSYASMVGLANPQSIVGKCDLELPSGLHWPKYEEYCQRMTMELKAITIPVEKIGFYNKNEIIAKIELVPLQTPEGQIFGKLVTIDNISLISDSEERSRAVFESSLDCLVTIDAESQIVSANNATVVTFGYSLTELLGSCMIDLIIPPDMREAHRSGMKRHLESGYMGILGRRIEVMAMRKNEELFPVELTVVPFEASGKHYFLGSLRDISDVKNNEKMLKAEEEAKVALISELEKMHYAIEEHNAIIISDRNAVIQYVNKKMCDITGYSDDELIGASMSKLKSEMYEAKFYEQLWKTILSGKVWSGVLANRNKRGSLSWFNTSIVPSIGENGEIDQFIYILTDISEIYRLQTELEKSIEREQTVGFDIQQTLLYGSAPAIENIQISAFTAASMGVDGDFYSTQVLDEMIFDVAIGDVMGKGTAAALIAAAAKQQINQALTRRQINQKLPSVEDVIKNIQHHMVDKLIELERFLTLFYCRVDLDAMAIHYVDFGHGLAIHIKVDGVHNLLGDNLPLGVINCDPAKIYTSQLNEGDLIFLYSDGVVDATNIDGDRFCDTTLFDILSECYVNCIPACIITNLIEQQVINFEAGQPIVDDRTIIAMRVERCRPNLHTIDLGWSIDGLGEVRQAIQGIVEKSGMRVEKCDGMTLATIESFTNILRHAKKPSTSAAIHCRIERLINTIQVDFYYVGEPFFPNDGLPDFSGESDGGFGLYIVRNSVDVVEYSSPVPGVCLTRLLQGIV